MKLHKSIIVAGAHRSGTTIIGDILCSKMNSVQLYEPFNVDSGINGLNHWYVNLDHGKNGEQEILSRFMRGVAKFKHSGVKEGLSRLVRRENIKMYTATAWKYEIVFRFPRALFGRIVIKDPFLTYGARSLIEKYDCKVIFTVKHPCAYYMSLLRMGWHDSTPIESLLAQGIISSEDAAWANNPVKQTALFWNAINRYVALIVAEYPMSATYIYHDKFCLNPANVLSSALEDIGLSITKEELVRLNLRTNGLTVHPKDKTLHMLNRRAIDMPNSWQKYLSNDDERLLMKTCGPVLQHFVS